MPPCQGHPDPLSDTSMSSEDVPTLSSPLADPASAPLKAPAALLFADYVPPLTDLAPPFADSSNSAPPLANSC